MHRQHGPIARRQLLALGVSATVIDHRVRKRRLLALYRGVYVAGHRRLTRKGYWSGAVLACGPDAALSHWDATTLHDLLPAGSRRLIDVTVAARGRRGHPGIRLHWVRSLHPDDVTVVDGIPVTTVARTLLDLAEVARPDQLERAVEQAIRIGTFDLNELKRVMARGHGRHGLKPLRAVLARLHPDGAATRSDMEARLLDLCRDWGLPPPRVNVIVEGYEVDAYWPQSKLVVELDGFAHHSSRRSFDEDHARTLALELAGNHVRRLTDPMLRNTPERVAAAIRAVLVEEA